MDFFNEYGTHFVKESVMGGRKESIFSVNYCSLEKSSSLKENFAAKLKLMYEGIHNIFTKSVYEDSMQESAKTKVVSGPTTTCIGGDTLNQEVRNPYSFIMFLQCVTNRDLKQLGRNVDEHGC